MFLREVVNEVCLIDIYHPVFDDGAERLGSDGVLHNCIIFSGRKDNKKVVKFMKFESL